MARGTSPLRYPGGKACLYSLVSSILRGNKLERQHYAEPFCGGSGLALSLLYRGYVSNIHINDIDPAIWAFWEGVLNHVEEFASLIANTPVTVDEWRRQREIYLARDETEPLALGFSAFFLNRTNRSGIIKSAGVIGGKDQTGSYKVNCRFNRQDLIRRVRRVAKYRGRIHLTRCDALEFVSQACETLPEKTFFCIDPPYYNKGSRLYTSFYAPNDHASLASLVLNIQNPWIVTYDKTPSILKLYRSHRQFEFNINYSVETKRQGTEIMITSKGLRIPPEIRNRIANRPQSLAA